MQCSRLSSPLIPGAACQSLLMSSISRVTSQRAGTRIACAGSAYASASLTILCSLRGCGRLSGKIDGAGMAKRWVGPDPNSDSARNNANGRCCMHGAATVLCSSLATVMTYGAWITMSLVVTAGEMGSRCLHLDFDWAGCLESTFTTSTRMRS